MKAGPDFIEAAEMIVFTFAVGVIPMVHSEVCCGMNICGGCQ
jgi:hypothetical protein